MIVVAPGEVLEGGSHELIWIDLGERDLDAAHPLRQVQFEQPGRVDLVELAQARRRMERTIM